MKLSDIIQEIEKTIEMFGDYELNKGSIYTDNVEVEAERINKFDVVVDEENKTARIILMS